MRITIILFAEGKMVLSYTTSSTGADKIAQPGAFSPPGAIPDAVDDCGQGGGPAEPESCWFSILTQPGVVIGTGHLYLDPGAYRNPMIFELAEEFYGIGNLYTSLLAHNLIVPAAVPAGAFGLKGTNATYPVFDYLIIYEHNALALARTNPKYRYVHLPDAVNLGDPEKNAFYRRAAVVQPGVPGTPAVCEDPGDTGDLGRDRLERGPQWRQRHPVFGISPRAGRQGRLARERPNPHQPSHRQPPRLPKASTVVAGARKKGACVQSRTHERGRAARRRVDGWGKEMISLSSPPIGPATRGRTEYMTQQRAEAGS